MLEDDADPGLTHHGINILIKRTNYRKIKISVELSDLADFH